MSSKTRSDIAYRGSQFSWRSSSNWFPNYRWLGVTAVSTHSISRNGAAKVIAHCQMKKTVPRLP